MNQNEISFLYLLTIKQQEYYLIKLSKRFTLKIIINQEFRSQTYLDDILKYKSSRQQRKATLLSNIENLPDDTKKEYEEELSLREHEYIRILMSDLSKDQYQPLKMLNKGAYGEVYLVKLQNTMQMYAMKKISKDFVQKQHGQNGIKLENDILSSNFKHVIKLLCSFQDAQNLYFVMEYAPGGDYMGLLMRENILPEKVAKFYIAELIQCFHELHNFNIIYRDGKPDNILIRADGHLCLTDFGLSCITKPRESIEQEQQAEENIQIQSNPRLQAHSNVGSINYQSYEMITNKAYSELTDYWSVGCILFESIFGYAPFQSEYTSETRHKIKHFSDYLIFPSGYKVSQSCIDLIQKLICKEEERLNYNQIINHPFFKGIDFKNIFLLQPPFKPNIKKPDDTQYFDTVKKTNQTWFEENIDEVERYDGFTHKPFPQTVVLDGRRKSLHQLFEKNKQE